MVWQERRAVRKGDCNKSARHQALELIEVLGAWKAVLLWRSPLGTARLFGQPSGKLQRTKVRSTGSVVAA